MISTLWYTKDISTLSPRFDCHFHTTQSDGLYTPLQAIAEAKKQKLDFLACTNHDLIDRSFVSLAQKEGIEAIPAVEISVREDIDPTKVLSIHMTTYAREFSSRVDQVLDSVCVGRRAKVTAQLIKLQKYGFDIPSDDFYQYWQKKWLNLENVGNGHIAKYLFPDEAELRSRFEANDTNLYDLTGRRFEFRFFLFECLKDQGSHPFWAARVPEYEPNISETARIIREEWAICSIAHSHLNYAKLGSDVFRARAEALITRGSINALEIHSSTPKDWVDMTLDIRAKTGIILTFGSDCHFETASDGKHAWLGTLNPHISPALLAKEFGRFRERLGLSVY